ncbi:MAG: DUF4340 domain-containing protein [Saprospiraceae bacterium]
MKNKHLVLIFFLSLGLGLAVRHAPWRESAFFRTKLLPIDTALVTKVEIFLPGQQQLVLIRNDEGWEAEQMNRSAKVPPNISRRMLAALNDLYSIRIAKTLRPDSLGFSKGTVIEVEVDGQKRIERFSIGWEIIEQGQPATYIRLPNHEGIYLVENQLREIFSKTLLDFRKAGIAEFHSADVEHFSILRNKIDSLYFKKRYSDGGWESGPKNQVVPDSSVQDWLSKVSMLNKLPFADLFDENHASTTLFAQIILGMSRQTDPLILKIYRLNTLNLPEEKPDLPLDKSQFSPYVLYFSHDPGNYFALSDTGLLRQICQPFAK